jgi:hypothetical protein
MTAPAQTAWYVYAVLPQTAALPSCLQRILPGAGMELIAAPAIGLAALVSRVPRAAFTAAQGPGAADNPDWIAARAAAHHGVVCAAASEGPCVPLGFGTLFSTIEALRAWLASYAPGLNQALAEFGGYQEWAILLSEEAAAHAEWLARTDQALVGLAGAIAAASPGTAFLMARRMDKAVLAARATHAGTAAARIAAALQAGGWRLRAEPARAGHVAGWSLLAQSGSPLEPVIASLAGELHGTGLALRAAGPFPPYAFARAAWAEEQNVA